MAEIRDILLRMRADTKEAEAGIKNTGLAFTELLSKVNLAEKAFQATTSAYSALAGAIARGQGVSELSNAFANLGGTAKQLDTLRQSVQGLISDTDLMRASNEALLAGLSPEQFERIAKAADTLGDAVGVNTKDAMDQLTRAVNTGNERLLKQYGIVIDNKKAEELFAEQIGVTADKLNEAGKKEAARIAILEKMEQQAIKTGEGHITAGDGVQKMGAALDNIIDKVTQAINENQALAEALDYIATEIANFDPNPMISGITQIVSVIGRAIALVEDFQRGLELLQNKTPVAQIVNTDNRITSLSGDNSTFGKAYGAFEIPRLEAQKQKIIESARAQNEFNQLLGELPLLYDGATRGIGTFTGKLVYQRDAFVSTNAAAKDAADKGLKDFKGSLETIVGIFDKTYVTDGSFFEKAFGATDTTFEMEKLNEAFENSVSFFGDLLTPMFEGQAANFEDIFKDAAKRIAIGFASQMAASVALSLGFNVSGVGGAGGLGQILAASLGFTGGGTQTLGALFGGGAGGGGGGGFMGFGGGGAAAGYTVGGVAGAAGVAAGAALFYSAVQTFEKSNKEFSDAAKAGAQTYLAGDPTGFSQAYFALADTFAGSTDPGVIRRRGIRGALQETGLGESLSFMGVGGSTSLFDSGYVQDPSNPQNAGAIALANPLANLFTGGDDEAGGQLAAMFADATDNAENYNEVLINTQALMEGLGINAEEAKTGLAELYLDGKIGLDEFSSGIAELNILAQEDLVGDNSVMDAFNILSKNLGEEGSPRTALKGLEFAFKELAQQGIDSPAEIQEYVTQKFGPEVAAVFEKLRQVGVDSFDDIGTLGPDKLAAVFGALSELEAGFANTKTAADQLGEADGIKKQEQNAKSLKKALDDVTKSAKDAARAINSIPENSGGGGNPNQPNNANGQ